MAPTLRTPAAIAACLAGLLAATALAEPRPAEERQRALVHRHTLQTAATGLGAPAPSWQLPPGFRLQVFASALGHPRMLDTGPDGTLYVTRRDEGDVLALRDTDGDGQADEQRSVVRGLEGVHGIAWRDGSLVIASSTTLWRVPAGGGSRERLVTGLPDGGQHPNRMVRFGPDGWMYVSIGSSCNDCAEENQLERATIIRYTPDGARREVVANGLRNTIGYDWHPSTGAMWGMDHGSDFRGDTLPPEELNHIVLGANYGWPICHGDRHVDGMTQAPPERMALRPGDPTPIGEPMPRTEYCAKTAPATLTLPAHSAPMAMRFVPFGRGWPEAWQGDAIVALRGSWNRREPVGYKLVRIRFGPHGGPNAVEDFLTGFLDKASSVVHGRPVGLAFGPDGALFVSDDTLGRIYRITPPR